MFIQASAPIQELGFNSNIRNKEEFQTPPSQIISYEIFQKAIAKAQCNGTTKSKRELNQLISTLNSEQLVDFLEKFMNDLNRDIHLRNPLREIHTLAEALNLENLQEAIRTKYPNYLDALKAAKQMFSQAKYYLDNTEIQVAKTLRTKISSLIDNVFVVLDALIDAFGIAGFFKQAESENEASFKTHQIMMLLGAFSMISGALIPLLGAALAGPIIAGVLFTIATLSLIYPKD